MYWAGVPEEVLSVLNAGMSLVDDDDDITVKMIGKPHKNTIGW